MGRKIKNFSNYLSRFVSDERIEAIAKASSFKKRNSAISPKAFLDVVFFCNSDKSPSLSEYSIDLEHQHGVSVSKQALDKRFNENTKQMLKDLLQEVLTKQMANNSVKSISSSWFTDIRIMDSSEFKVSKRAADTFPGYGGEGREASVQIQFEYQLLSSMVTELSIGSSRDSDSIEGMKNIKKVPPKTLLLRDLGYFPPKAFEELSSKGIYFISRAKSQWNFYTLKGGEYSLLSTASIISLLKDQKEKYLDMEVYVGQKACMKVRLVANLLTEEQKQKRLKNKSARRKLGPDALEAIGINLFVTNVESEKCTASQVYDLYSLRWQVELVFKTWKSVMKLHKIHPMNATRLECIILIKLLWVMLNWTFLNHLKRLTQMDLSFHKLVTTLQGRSKSLALPVLQNSHLLFEWLTGLYRISKVFHEKEYKKGRKKVSDILARTCQNVP
ncbi:MULTISPECIES: IS4 family transposase [unclassified Imperialibacter]|uniref:IS4 family transposase n=1 Tax=unclassified Imperialibacter TaxID=2629706 RepID=UPI001254853B|nr:MULTISPECIES: IS4 family transposase [unclassified Imperialibacter]CAD5273032.1 hypothetical protein IMPERIA89_350019 [Imperialibacter sp. 89]CAD5288706.1 hypothetical protein IMPERIA75_620020 [Imperialibacter sp. 75]VVT14596.1 transposase [Imperialibacter sp. EC-SDR9]